MEDVQFDTIYHEYFSYFSLTTMTRVAAAHHELVVDDVEELPTHGGSMGARGLRLRESSEAIPKPMVSIGARSILWHVMRYYAHYGHRDFILCLGYRRAAASPPGGA